MPQLSFHTDDADEAHAHLSQAYMEISVHRFDPAGPFSLDTSFAPLGDTVFGRSNYTAAAHLRTTSFDNPCFVMLSGGAYRASRPGDECDASIGGALLLAPCRQLDLIVDDCRFTSVTVPHEQIELAAEANTGQVHASVNFESGRAVSPARERQWVSTVAHVQRAILGDPVLAANQLITGQAQRLLASMALFAFPNSAGAPRDPVRAGRETIRRATGFIESRVADDISVTDIARAARVDVRTLRRAFRQHLDTTPSAYLRRARLDQAHRELREAGVVTAAARRWGFADAGRFAAEYRQAYGPLPGESS